VRLFKKKTHPKKKTSNKKIVIQMQTKTLLPPLLKDITQRMDLNNSGYWNFREVVPHVKLRCKSKTFSSPKSKGITPNMKRFGRGKA
jgi:hypothetical protein